MSVKSDLPTPAEAAERARRETVEAWVAAHPEWTTRQFAEAWGYSPAGAWNALALAGYAHYTKRGWQKGSE